MQYFNLNKNQIKEILSKDTIPDYVDFIWKPFSFDKKQTLDLHVTNSQRERMNKLCIFYNHLDNHSLITSKTGIIHSLKPYYYKQTNIDDRYNIWDTIPTSFILQNGKENFEFTSFIARFKEISKQFYKKEKMPAKHLSQNLWLIKPANSNQGRGIEVFNNLKEILKFLETKSLDSKWVVQKYLEKPLLWHNRKFDIRVWVLVTSKGEIFYYEQGYMRTTTQEYND